MYLTSAVESYFQFSALVTSGWPILQIWRLQDHQTYDMVNIFVLVAGALAATLATALPAANELDFFSEESFCNLCSHGKIFGNTSTTSPYVEDCAYLTTFLRTPQNWGWWNLDGLVANKDYKLLSHNTCSVYYRVQTGHDSLQ